MWRRDGPLAISDKILNDGCVSSQVAPPIDFTAGLSVIGAAVDEHVLLELRRARLRGLRKGHAYIIQRLVVGPATASQMAESLGVTQQAVSKAVGELIALGYVRQSVDRADRRRRPLSLTARGRRAVEVSRAARSAIEDRIRAAGGPRRLASAKAVLAVTADVLGIAEQIETCSVPPPLERS
jgi:DNA-binding MarR family transcriptional regulator